MADYISREALLERIDDIWDCADMVFEPNDKCCRADDCASCKWAETKRAIRKIVEYFPAADVRENKRGKWKQAVGENGVTSACRCSICGFEDNRYSLFNYCPNCGADMREEQT